MTSWNVSRLIRSTCPTTGIRRVAGVHCQHCGSTSAEDVPGEDGYTGCCNERSVYDCDRCDDPECFEHDCSHD